MRAYLIDPFARTITEVDYDGNYRSIYPLIEAECFEAVSFGEKDDAVFVNEEGLINGKPQEYFQIKGTPTPLAGKGLVLGCDAEGDSCSPTIMLEALTALVEWVSFIVIENATTGKRTVYESERVKAQLGVSA